MDKSFLKNSNLHDSDSDKSDKPGFQDENSNLEMQATTKKDENLDKPFFRNKKKSNKIKTKIITTNKKSYNIF